MHLHQEQQQYPILQYVFLQERDDNGTQSRGQCQKEMVSPELSSSTARIAQSLLGRTGINAGVHGGGRAGHPKEGEIPGVGEREPRTNSEEGRGGL